MCRKECSTLSNLVTDAKNSSGPLFSLFASLLGMNELAVSANNQSVTEAGLAFMMRLAVGIVLILPLFALAVVLVVRAVVMWMVIAFSPLLVLAYVFQRKD